MKKKKRYIDGRWDEVKENPIFEEVSSNPPKFEKGKYDIREMFFSTNPEDRIKFLNAIERREQEQNFSNRK